MAILAHQWPITIKPRNRGRFTGIQLSDWSKRRRQQMIDDLHRANNITQCPHVIFSH